MDKTDDLTSSPDLDMLVNVHESDDEYVHRNPDLQ